MLNGPASYGARDSIQCVPIESLIPFSLNEWRERTAFIFYVEPLAISRTQCPSQEDNKFYLRQNHEATVFNCTTSTREKKEKSEDLKGSLTFMWLSNSGYDSSLPRTEQPCVFICVCVGGTPPPWFISSDSAWILQAITVYWESDVWASNDCLHQYLIKRLISSFVFSVYMRI